MSISLFNEIKNHQPIFTSNDRVFFIKTLDRTLELRSQKIIAQLKDILNASAGYPSYASIDVNGKIIISMTSLNHESLKAAAGL